MKKLIQGFDPVYYADEEGNIYRNDKNFPLLTMVQVTNKLNYV